MNRQGFKRILGIVVVLTGLSACASGPREEERPLPSYAFPFITSRGLDTWTVRCPMQSITGLDRKDTSMFYNSDGTQKSLVDFCRDNDAASRIPAPSED